MENGIEDDYQDIEPAHMQRHDFDDIFQMDDMLIPGMYVGCYFISIFSQYLIALNC